jgi:hypothetical protein
MMEHIRMFVSDLRQVGSFLRFPPQRYNCNIAENGVKDQHFLKIVHNLCILEDLKYYPYRATYDIEAMLEPTYKP